MRNRVLTTVLLFLSTLTATGFGQVLSNSSLTGKYFVRHVEFTTDANNNAVDARSIYGSILFDGVGHYAIAGQQVIGANPNTTFTVNGAYAMAPSGMVTLTNPQNTGLTINARFGSEAVFGSSTDAGGAIFDMFIAIPAPVNTAYPAFSNATLGVNFHMADWELTNAQTRQARVSGMSATFDGLGNIQTFRPVGHSAATGGSTLAAQEFTGTYSVTGSGAGTMVFSAVAGTITPPGPALLQPNTRTLYISATRNVFFAVLPASHDILIGIRNGPSDPIGFSGRYWFDGFQINSGGSSGDFVAAASVGTNANTVLLTQRSHQVPPITTGAPSLLNETQTYGYAFLLSALDTSCNCGIGAYQNVVVTGTTFLMSGNNGTLLGVTPSVDVNGTPNADTNTYFILFGQQIPNVRGQGVFLNPQGIVNAATYAPAGDYISPGEFIQLYGSGFVLSDSMTAASLPFPPALDDVSVTINDVLAPVFYVSPEEIICIVPYGLTGTTATIVVTSGQTQSNPVTVGAAPTSPGVFSANDFGFGDGAITHVDNTSVNSDQPAQPLETVQMYVSGLGVLSAPVANGYGAFGINDAVTKPVVFVNGVIGGCRVLGAYGRCGALSDQFHRPGRNTERRPERFDTYDERYDGSVHANNLDRRSGRRQVGLALVSNASLCLKRADQTKGPHSKLAQIERFSDKFIGTAAEAPGEGFVRAVRGKDQNRHALVPGGFPQRAQDLKSVHAGHLEIQHQEIVRALAEARQGVRAPQHYFRMYLIRP